MITQTKEDMNTEYLEDMRALRDSTISYKGLTKGDIVKSDFWYGEVLTWRVVGFDTVNEIVKLQCEEYGMPTQTAHISKFK